MASRNIPAEIRRAVRKESKYGCAACGCPVLDYHHIIPFHKSKKHEVHNIIALCPTCHRKAGESGAWSQEYVRKLKNNPFNKMETRDRFAIMSNNFFVKLGDIEFHTLGHLVALREEIVLSCEKNDEIIVITGTFNTADGKPFARIVENEWIVETDEVWDIEYTAGSKLVVRSKMNVILQLQLTTSCLDIQQCCFTKDNLILKQFIKNNKNHTSIIATGTFFYDTGKRIIFRNPPPGPAITLR